jgi:beta-galactosidase
VQLLDAAGVRNPKSEQLVKFEIEGPGQIVGVGNGNPVSTDSYQQPQRKAWQGRVLVVVKSGKEPGIITLKASSAGVKPASITIAAKAP